MVRLCEIRPLGAYEATDGVPINTWAPTARVSFESESWKIE